MSRSGLYEYRHRRLSSTALRAIWLTGLITEIHARSRGTYGARRVHAELTIGMGVSVSYGTIEKLMRIAGVQGIPKRKGIKNIKQHPTTSDLVNRQFTRTQFNQLWVTDITEHPTREGKLYCCAVLDAFSRKIAGWSIDNNQNANLVVNALDMAIKNRKPSAETVIHSDHGTQGEFTSWVFTSKIKEAGWLPSLGTVGDAYDNGMMESFWSKMQTELFNRKRWSTRVELANAMFEYLEIFHNRQRRHSKLGYLTPVEYERMHLESKQTA